MAGQDIEMNAFTPATDGAYIYAEATNGSQVKIKKSDLASILKGYLGIIERITISGNAGSGWYRIMEFENNSSAIFMLSLSTYSNQPQSLMVGCASVFDNIIIQSTVSQLAGKAGISNFHPDVRYKFVDNKLVFWSKGSAAGGNNIYILRGKASAYPMVQETPPSDAIAPTY